jgi:hypothetical protein
MAPTRNRIVHSRYRIIMLLPSFRFPGNSPVSNSYCAKGTSVRELVSGERPLKCPMKMANGQWGCVSHFRWIVGVRFLAMVPTARENAVRDVCRAGMDCRSYRAWQTIARQPQPQHPKPVRPNSHHENRRHYPGRQSRHNRDGDVDVRMRQSS